MKYFLLITIVVFAVNASAQKASLPPRPAIKDVSITNARCFGDPSGSISIQASNGYPPFIYSINGGKNFQRDNFFSGLGAGTYSVLIRDSLNRYSDSQEVQITEPQKLLVQCSGSMQCGANSGVVNINAAGGTPPYVYTWNNGIQISPTQTGLTAGTYIVNVFDIKQCTDTCSVVLQQLQGSSTPKYKVGDSISCGYIFYINPVADSAHPCSTHYLVCSKADQSKSVTWYNNSFLYTVTNATTDMLFDRMNAIKIDSFSLAANASSSYTTDSCSGWYLPSKSELEAIYKNLASRNIGHFAKEGYWSSVEGTKRHAAWIVDFLNGRDIQNDKSNKYHARAICDVWLPNN